MAISSINPANGNVVKRFEEISEAELEAKMQLSVQAFAKHRKTSFAQRAELMRRAAEILERDKRTYGQMMTEEMGKTLKSAIAEAEKCATAFRYYAEHGEAFLRDEQVKTDADQSYIRYLPIGPVLAIMPWNFPFWQVVRFAAPALMAGNVGLLKHASNVPRCALALEDLIVKAGFVQGAFQTLLLESKHVSRLIDDPRVRAVTLTGSEGAGVAVGAQAGKQIKKSVLELGGSDPFIVMPSANLDEAVRTAVVARNINNGQSCIAAKRFIVHEKIYAEFEKRFVARLRELKVGDPMREDTDIGPLASESARKGIAEQVERSVAAGAKLLVGGKSIDGPGYYYAATALGDIPEKAPVFRDEVFGPVALLFKVRDIDHAIALANDSSFGLGSSVWTHDPDERQRFIDELEAGMTFVNAMVASDARLPFGGVKRSGYGRELSTVGLREFVNIKSVVIHDKAVAQLPSSE
ncbi:MAG TPA: NAD-dependent succinate-semialdehyde dehydrogenase [Polyangiales bacterium]|nr:NAD-dependent succinate-semialdehyde dehydrogenase [Polyangiales bacterium]